MNTLAPTWRLAENLPHTTQVLLEAFLVIEPTRQPAGRGRKKQILGCLETFAELLLGLVQVKAGLGVQLGPFYIHPGPAKAATNCRSLCSSKQDALGQSQVVPDTGVYQSHSQRSPESTHPVANFRQHQSYVQLASQATYSKGDLGRHQTQVR